MYTKNNPTNPHLPSTCSSSINHEPTSSIRK
jgi:hypothetical protein